jgi:hypothetical protein
MILFSGKMKRFFFVFFVISFFNTSVFAQDDFYDINAIREIKIYFQEDNWDKILDSLFINFGESARLKGDVTIDGHLLKGVGVRYKGYSSWDVDQVKSPFNVELDYSLPNQNYQGYTKLKLSNVIRDPSFIREALSYEILRKYMPASKANYAKVYVNDVYIGLYTNVEAVDKIFAGKRFGSDANSFFKGSPAQLQYPYGENSNLAYSHGTDSLDYVPYYKMESDFGWSDLLNLIYILNNDTSAVSTVLNIDRSLWMHAFNYTLVNLDSYIGYSQNYYMYKDDNGVFNPIIWDLNMSFGSFRNTDATTLNLTIAKIKQLNPLQILTSNTFSPRPLIKNLLSNQTYRKMFLAHMRTIVNENFRNNEYYVRGKEIHTFIDPFVQSDTNKFYPYSYFTKNIDTTVGPTSNNYPGIKDLMEARIAYLDTFPGFRGYPEVIEIKHKPETPAKNQETWFTASVNDAKTVLLGYRNNSRGIFQKIQMFDDGLHNDSLAGDHVYGASIVPSGNIVQYFIYSENDSAGAFSPERAEYEFYSLQTKIDRGEIAINEMCDDWIELFNNTGETMQLKGVYFSDDRDVMNKWQFPDTTIASKEYLIVWTDKNLENNLHTNFTINSSGGGLYLANPAFDIIDSMIYGKGESGKSIGRYPNGVGDFVYMPKTFAYSNNIVTSAGYEVLIYPNPAIENVTLEYKNTEQPISVEVYDASGRSVLYREYESQRSNMNACSESINISALLKGFYIVKTNINNKIVTNYLIKI